MVLLFPEIIQKKKPNSTVFILSCFLVGKLPIASQLGRIEILSSPFPIGRGQKSLWQQSVYFSSDAKKLADRKARLTVYKQTHKASHNTQLMQQFRQMYTVLSVTHSYFYFSLSCGECHAASSVTRPTNNFTLLVEIEITSRNTFSAIFRSLSINSRKYFEANFGERHSKHQQCPTFFQTKKNILCGNPAEFIKKDSIQGRLIRCQIN